MHGSREFLLFENPSFFFLLFLRAFFLFGTFESPPFETWIPLSHISQDIYYCSQDITAAFNTSWLDLTTSSFLSSRASCAKRGEHSCFAMGMPRNAKSHTIRINDQLTFYSRFSTGKKPLLRSTVLLFTFHPWFSRDHRIRICRTHIPSFKIFRRITTFFHQIIVNTSKYHVCRTSYYP